jgi:hypothetical protein
MPGGTCFGGNEKTIPGAVWRDGSPPRIHLFQVREKGDVLNESDSVRLPRQYMPLADGGDDI